MPLYRRLVSSIEGVFCWVILSSTLVADNWVTKSVRRNARVLHMGDFVCSERKGGDMSDSKI